MTKSELIKKLAEQEKLSQVAVAKVLDALAHVAAKTLREGGEFALHGIGTIKPVKRAARKGRNVRTGEIIDVPAKVVPKMSFAKAIKDAAAKSAH